MIAACTGIKGVVMSTEEGQCCQRQLIKLSSPPPPSQTAINLLLAHLHNNLEHQITILIARLPCHLKRLLDAI